MKRERTVPCGGERRVAAVARIAARRSTDRVYAWFPRLKIRPCAAALYGKTVLALNDPIVGIPSVTGYEGNT